MIILSNIQWTINIICYGYTGVSTLLECCKVGSNRGIIVPWCKIQLSRVDFLTRPPRSSQCIYLRGSCGQISETCPRGSPMGERGVSSLRPAGRTSVSRGRISGAAVRPGRFHRTNTTGGYPFWTKTKATTAIHILESCSWQASVYNSCLYERLYNIQVLLRHTSSYPTLTIVSSFCYNLASSFY